MQIIINKVRHYCFAISLLTAHVNFVVSLVKQKLSIILPTNLLPTSISPSSLVNFSRNKTFRIKKFPLLKNKSHLPV